MCQRKQEGGEKGANQQLLTDQVEIIHCFDHMHKFPAGLESLQPRSKVPIKGKICKETRPTLHMTCGPNGPAPGDVIGGMSPFASAKEQYVRF